MLSLIDVTCPHCGAQGQIIMPPMDAIIVGPCPECQGMVMVFCGKALPLNKEVMFEGTANAKKQHLMDVISGFIKERVDRLVSDVFEDEFNPESFPDPLRSDGRHDNHEAHPQRSRTVALHTPITPQEIDQFVNHELQRIDNKEYFKAIFGA